MNSVFLIGRLTKDPEESYTASQMAVCKFTLAVDRITRAGEEKKADFPRITVFGKSAENCVRFLHKGSQVAVSGRLQTGSYQNKDGVTVYTTDVVADRVEFLGSGSGQAAQQSAGQFGGSFTQPPVVDDAPSGFSAIEEDIPF